MPIDSGNLALKGLDDLFSTEENRQEEQREQVQQIPMQRMFEDGMRQIGGPRGIRTLDLSDANRTLSHADLKEAPKGQNISLGKRQKI